MRCVFLHIQVEVLLLARRDLRESNSDLVEDTVARRLAIGIQSGALAIGVFARRYRASARVRWQQAIGTTGGRCRDVSAVCAVPMRQAA